MVQWCYTPNSQSRLQRYHISIWKSIKYQNIWNQIKTVEESSWIPPTCFPASTNISTIPISLQYEIIAVYVLIKYYPLNNGVIGSHPLNKKCGKSTTAIYTYANIYILILYIIPISLFMKYSRYMFLINNIRLLTAYNVYFNNQ